MKGADSLLPYLAGFFDGEGMKHLNQRGQHQEHPLAEAR